MAKLAGDWQPQPLSNIKTLERILRSNSVPGLKFDDPNMCAELEKRHTVLIESLYSGGCSYRGYRAQVGELNQQIAVRLGLFRLARRASALKPLAKREQEMLNALWNRQRISKGALRDIWKAFARKRLILKLKRRYIGIRASRKAGRMYKSRGRRVASGIVSRIVQGGLPGQGKR